MPGSSSGQMPKPEVDRIDGLSPSISIQQKTGGRNPRSTVGTITEINDYLRVLYARVGQGHCPNCGRPVAAQTREQIVARILEELPAGTSFLVLAPVVRGQKGEYKDLFADLAKAGYVRARVNGQVVNLTDDLALDRQIKHQIEVVIDRLKAGPTEFRFRTAWPAGRSGRTGPEARARGRSSSRPKGGPTGCCRRIMPAPPAGSGSTRPARNCSASTARRGCAWPATAWESATTSTPSCLVPDPSLSVWDGAIAPLGPVKEMGRWRRHLFEGVAANLEADPDGPPKGSMLKGPWRDLDDKWRRAWLYGTGDRHDRPPLEEQEQGLVARREMGRRGQRSADQVPRRRRRPDPRAARAVHAEHDLPRMPGTRLNPRRAGCQGRRQDPGRARRHAHRPGLPVLRCAGRRDPGCQQLANQCHSTRPGLADDRRGAAQGDPAPAQVPDRRRPRIT